MIAHMALHHHFAELSEPLKKYFETDSEDEGQEDGNRERRRKSRLIGYKSRGNSSDDFNVEKFSVALGLFFVAAVTCYAVYLGYKQSKDNESLSGFKMKELTFEDSTKGMYNEFRLPNDLLPLHYILYMYPNLENMQYSGLVKIRFECKSKTDKIILHSAHHNFTKIAIKTINVTDIEDILVTKSQRNLHKEMLILTLNQELVSGYSYDVYIGFHGEINKYYTNGLYSSINNGKRVVSTMFRPTFARRTFPCFDEPQFKTPFKLIIQHNSSLNAVSNMAEMEHIKLEDSENVECHFKESQPISTNQLSFVVSEMKFTEKTTKSGIKVRVFSDEINNRNADFALNTTIKMLEYYGNKIQYSYPNSKLDLVPMESIPLDATSNYALIELYEPLLLFDVKTGTLFQQEKIIRTLANAIASQWFGGIISQNWWDEVYLFEGFSAFYSTKLLEDLYKDWKFDETYLYNEFQEGLRADASRYAKILAETSLDSGDYQLQAPSVAQKSEAIVRMMSEVVGEKGFIQTVKNIFQQMQFSVVTLTTLGNTFVTFVPSVDVVDFLHFWTSQKGFPIVTTKISDTQTQLLVVQNKFDYVKQTKWTLWRFQIPTEFSCSSKGVEKYVTEAHNEFFGLPASCITADKGKKFLDNNTYKCDAGGRGFFRVDYEKGDWKNLQHILKNDMKKLQPLDRADLISDLFEFSMYNYRSIGDAMLFTEYLDKETHYAPLYAGISKLQYLNDIIEDQTLKRCLKEYTSSKISSTYERTKNQNMTSVEDKHIEHLVIDYITNKENKLSESLIREYEIQFLKWLLSGERNLLSNYMRDVIVKVGLKYGSNYELDDVITYYRKSEDAVEKGLLLEAIGRTQKQHKLLSSEDNFLSSEEQLKLITYSCSSNVAQSSTDYGYKHLNKNWDKVIDLIRVSPNAVRDFMWSCFGKYSNRYDLEKFKSLFAGKELGALSNVYKRVEEQIQHNIHFVQNQSGELRKFFQKYRPACLKDY
ncbi:endoplasmic reticulum aminopeptidase 1-like isoform X2 [Clytia hemisphaerica]|uniref:Aminopeptidase n=1 Tax=Clytia hemisphaerica TaxID=252671 RepID=A0A7M5WV64_9CNID